MYAIIATGGKQYKVAEGDIINVEKLGVEAGETVTFDQVLAVSNDGLTGWCPAVAARNCYRYRSKERQGKKSYRLQVQEKNWLPQEKRSQTAVHTG